jgi:hypothetical protein
MWGRYRVFFNINEMLARPGLDRIIILWLYSPLTARACQPNVGLISSCTHIEMKDHPAILGMICGKVINFSAIIGFLEQYYSHKSIT